MPRPRSRARQDDFDEFEEDDFEGGGSPAGNQKLKRLITELVGRWYWIVLFLILGLLGAAYYLSKAPKLYSTSCSLLIKTQTESLMSQDQVEDVSLRSIEAMNTAAARIGRFELLERVASREDVRALPGLIPPPVDWRPEWWAERADGLSIETAPEDQPVPPPPALAGRIRSWLDISITRGTRLMELQITHPVPEVAKAVADAIAREYLAEVRADMTSGRSGAIEVLDEESKDAREKLQQARAALAVYARALEAHQALDEQEILVAQLDQRYLPAHPKMEAANIEYERLKERFLSEFEIARESPSDKDYWSSVAGDLPDPEAERDRYLRVARQQLLARTGVLGSEIESLNSVFQSMLTRMSESSVNQESEETPVEVNSLARVPGLPSAPVANKIYTAGVGGGFAVGLAIAFLLARLDNKYETVAQVEEDSNATVLAAISHINESHLRQAEDRYLKKHPEELTEAYDEWDPLLVFRPGTIGTSYAEMYRILRASISLLGDETKRKVTVFTSALPGEGKTATSVNFALAAAAQKRRTLLIDCDLRKPSVHKAFGMSRETDRGGITEVLAGQMHPSATVLDNFPEDHLHVILSGKRAPNPGELLDTGRLKAVLAWAEQHYDVIVLDTAPLLAVPDTRIIAPLIDNFCLVVRAHYVPKGAVHRTLEVLQEDGTQLGGIVFNGFKEKKRLIGQNYSYGHYKMSRYGRSYQYGYGSYGSYGAYGSDEEDDEPRKNRRKVGSNRKRRKKRSS